MLCGEPTCLSFLPLMHSTDIDLLPPPTPSVLSAFISTIGTLSSWEVFFLYTLNFVVHPPSLVVVYSSSTSTLTGSNIALTCSITLEEDTVEGVTVEVVWTRQASSFERVTATGSSNFYTSNFLFFNLAASDDALHLHCQPHHFSAFPHWKSKCQQFNYNLYR